MYFYSQSTSHKKYIVRKIANPKIATFAEGPQIFKRIKVRKFADLVFADRPPLITKPDFLLYHLLWIIPNLE